MTRSIYTYPRLSASDQDIETFINENMSKLIRFYAMILLENKICGKKIQEGGTTAMFVAWIKKIFNFVYQILVIKTKVFSQVAAKK